jgi:hypothetical protein
MLFAIALVLRIAIPAGFMPTQTAHGMVVTICDGAGGGKTMVVDLQRSDDDNHHSEDQKPTARCAFAGLASPAIDAAPVVTTALRAMVFGEFTLPPPAAFYLPVVDFLTPPLRGPPALA